MSKDSIGSHPIGSGDILQIRVFTNEGYKLLDAGLAGDEPASSQYQELLYPVDADGFVRLPMIDTVSVGGLLIMEAERYIEERYSDHLIEPFVQVKVTNRRVYVYRGNEPAAVVTLDTDEVSLWEVLAKSGGVPAAGKSYQIKIIRKEPNGESRVYKVDLRDPDQVSLGNLPVRPGDVIVIDTILENTLLQQITPAVTILTSVLAVAGLVIALRN